MKNEKAFLDGAVFKEAMMIVANTIFKDDKRGPDVISTLSDVQLGSRYDGYVSVIYVWELNRATEPGPC